MSPSPIDTINRAVARLLRLNASRSAFAHSAAAAGVSLTLPAYLLLRAAIEQGPISMGQLAARVHMDPGTAARQVAKLVDAGYVRRRTDSADARVSLIEATPKGRAAGARLLEVRVNHLVTSLRGWSERDLATFARLLSRFVDDVAATGYESAATPDVAEAG